MTDEVKVKSGIGLGIKIFFGFILGAVLLGLCVLFSCLGLAGLSVPNYQRAKAKLEAKKTEEGKLSGSEQVAAPKGWEYAEEKDAMGRGVTRTASVSSVNEVDFGFPYQGKQTATLHLIIDPTSGETLKGVAVTLKRAQFLCDPDGCKVSVRFDEGAVEFYTMLAPADNSTNMLFTRDFDRFVANARKSKKVFIETRFYQQGVKVFEFNIEGLKW